jgi:hypothetical protein
VIKNLRRRILARDGTGVSVSSAVTVFIGVKGVCKICIDDPAMMDQDILGFNIFVAYLLLMYEG